MYYFDEINGKKILKSDLIKNAQAFFTTRGLCICDKAEKYQDKNSLTESNKKLVVNYLKVKQNNFISPVQTHSANVDIATENKFDYPDTDGLILTQNNLGIFLNFADCTPIIFYDEEQNIGAVCHAGWRGSAQKISQITAEKLINEYNSKPQNICVLIGPTICGECYEVGNEVYNNFSPPLPPLSNKVTGGRIDLKEINRKQLADIGITKIDICPYCTCCDNEYFFSYRKENGTTLRHSAVLKLG